MAMLFILPWISVSTRLQVWLISVISKLTIETLEQGLKYVQI